MSFHDNQLNKIEFSKFPQRIKKFPGIPAGNFWDAGFPGIPGGLAFHFQCFQNIILHP